MRKCPECGGEYQQKTITYDQPWGDQFYFFENVPAWVCSQCGAVYLEARVSQQIDRIIQTHQKPERYEKVPFFKFSLAKT